jgi:nitronate monooxygenase
MNFGSDNTKSKAWKDIWGAGQGVGTMNDISSVKDLVVNLFDEYNSAKTKFIK